MNQSKPGSLADGTDPAVSRTPVEALTVAAAQDRTLAALADGEIDRPRRARHQRNGGWLVAFPKDPQDSMAAPDAKILGVGGTRLGDPKAVQPEQHRQRCVIVVIAFGGEEESPQLGAIQAATLGRVNLGPADILRGVRGHAPVDMSETVEPANRRQAPIDRRGSQSSLFEPAPVQLDMRSGRLEHGEADSDGPVEVAA